MTHMPRNEGKTSHATALAGKRKVFLIFLRSCSSRDQKRSRKKKYCCDKDGEEIGSYFIFCAKKT